MTRVTGEPVKLLPRLGLLGVVFFGLAYLGPDIAVVTFGVVSTKSAGAAPTAYLLATVAMLLTAVAYAVLSREFPSSGSAYTYVGRILGHVTGFFAGWVILLDYLFLPMVLWLLQSTYLNAQFPGVPIWAWLIILIGGTTVVNLLGVALASRVSTIFVVISMLAVAALIVVLIIYLGQGHGGSVTQAVWNDKTSVAAVGSGAAVAVYSFLGFDAISTLAEETKDPRKNIPRGIILTVLAGGALFVTVSLLMQLVHPGGVFDNADTAGYTVAKVAGGDVFANVRNVVSSVATFAGAVAIQATSSRLLYVMGRDGVLPRVLFGRLSRAFHVPWINILIIAAIGSIATLLDIDTATSMINFGAFLAFVLVNISFTVWIWKHRATDWGAGRRVLMTVISVFGALVDGYLFSQLSHVAYVAGVSWLILGVVLVAIATRGFRRPVPRLAEGQGPALREPEPVDRG
jgi:amino acid transporter